MSFSKVLQAVDPAADPAATPPRLVPGAGASRVMRVKSPVVEVVKERSPTDVSACISGTPSIMTSRAMAELQVSAVVCRTTLTHCPSCLPDYCIDWPVCLFVCLFD
jgi:hypothetical protein